MSKTYPISLLITGKPVLVVGGGVVAARKVKGLTESGAQITVVSPEVCEELDQLIKQGACRWLERNYETADLEGMELVFACTNDEALNVRISAEAGVRRILVNVADRPELCTFFLPSVLRRGDLSIAVSTDGCSPLTARLIRESLESHVDDAMGAFLEVLHSWRPQVQEKLPPEKRMLFWEGAHNGQAYQFIKQGQREQAEAVLAQLFKELQG